MLTSAKQWAVALGIGAVVLVLAFVGAYVLLFAGWVMFLPPAD